MAVMATGGCYQARHDGPQGLKTIYFRLFENLTFRPGLEGELKTLLVRDLGLRTNVKFAGEQQADGEINGRILSYEKRVYQEDEEDQALSFQVTIRVEAGFKDWRLGREEAEAQKMHVFEGTGRFSIPRGETELTAQKDALKYVTDGILDRFFASW